MVTQNWKKPWCPSIDEWINNVSHPYKTILFSNKNKWVIKPGEDMDEYEMHIDKWKKPVWIGDILYDPDYMTLWKRQTLDIVKKIGGSRKEHRLNKWSTRNS